MNTQLLLAVAPHITRFTCTLYSRYLLALLARFTCTLYLLALLARFTYSLYLHALLARFTCSLYPLGFSYIALLQLLVYEALSY